MSPDASLETVTAWVIVLCLTIYSLLGGADFGGGVWDLFAHGPRKDQQRAHIAHAIGPIWEANHVWLIVLIVLLFSGFPAAFSAIMTALHIPVTLALIGIVARGTSFTFRTYDRPDAAQRRWGLVFSVSSLLTPVLLGVTLGTIASGELRFEGRVYLGSWIDPWLGLFPVSVGLFTLSIFALLAAVYLCVEVADADADAGAVRREGEGEGSRVEGGEDEEDVDQALLQEDFRKRALASGVAVGLFAGVTWLLALDGAPWLSERLSGSWWTWPLQILTGLAALTAIGALLTRRFILARAAAVLQASLIIFGFGAGMAPHLVVPDFTVQNAAAPPVMHALLLGALALGSLILLPSLYYLFRVFKGERAFALLDHAEGARRDPAGSAPPRG
ncbi:MAG: cytochrome d ubiquinol oxidase subunit II [bacterium]